MPRVRDLFFRFRPVGAPGGAGAAGVPVDRTAGVVAELAPLFARLADVERRCDRIEESGATDAARTDAAAAERSRAIVAEARERLEPERTAAAARASAATGADHERALAAARAEAVAVHDRAAPRLQEYVDRVVAQVRELIGAEQTRNVS